MLESNEYWDSVVGGLVELRAEGADIGARLSVAFEYEYYL